jgi:signal transduction histidine kinase
VAAEGDALAIPAPPFTDGGARPDAPKAKVLIVDDDERNAYAAVHALEELGHELVVARSGEEALRRVLTDDFAVILLDLHMPGMDGYETAALIRSRKRSRNTPIVFVTAVFRDEPHLFQAYASGAVDVVFKPADPFILRAKVQVLVDLHLKTMEISREAERRQRLLEENARVRAEKLRAEAQLAQAQKMEAVGQLTGGVAHDFNNLLTVVLGNLDLLDRKPEEDPRRRRQLAAIRHAAERGRSLTRQLLAFSRRQQLSPLTVDINSLIGNFASLMQQAVGESVTIRPVLEGGSLCAHVDPAQLETAILNLAVNARDAMPEGGDLTIATRLVDAGEELKRQHPEAEGGPWILVQVSDNGSGMPPEVLSRIFEPFFTTKEVGKGSGLGLSQVYGFVRQTGGYVVAKSEVGHGTTFQLYLKPTEGAVEQRSAPEAPRVAEGGAERILAVEDDPAVLSLTLETLSGLGYQVSTAADAREALEVLKGGEPFDLLFTDVMMPGGVGGIQLARQAREIRPDLKVLLTSGYVGEASVLDETDFPLLPKPYERGVLAAKIRDALANAAAT